MADGGPMRRGLSPGKCLTPQGVTSGGGPVVLRIVA